MNGKIRTFCVIFIITISLLSASIGFAAVEDVLKSITPEKMSQLLNEMKIEHEKLVRKEDGGDKIVFHLKLGSERTPLDVLLILGAKEKEGTGYQCLQLGAAFQEPPKSGAVNIWNRTKRFSRAYTAEDGRAIIESDLSIRGGVTLDNIKYYIKTFEKSVLVFMFETISDQVPSKKKMRKPGGPMPKEKINGV